MNKAIFLDKDGTLIENIPYNIDPEYMYLLPHVGKGLCMLQKLGFLLIVISNQSGVARGLFDEEELEIVKMQLDVELHEYGVKMDGFYYCPHLPEGNIPKYAIRCNCRKPNSGLYIKAAEDFSIDLSQSWTIWDILHDIEAGNRIGCKTIIIDNGNETEWNMSILREPTFIAKNFKEATDIIFSNKQKDKSCSSSSIKRIISSSDSNILIHEYKWKDY